MDQDETYTMKSVSVETVGQGAEQEEKPVVYFEETDKGLLLNKTNANTIAQLHGPETDGWPGKQITLFATDVDFGGKMTLAIRVRMRAPKPAPRQSAAAAAPANGDPAPARPAANAAAAKRNAWNAFKASSLPGTSQETITEEWHTAIAGFRPDVPEENWSADDWQKFVAAEFQTLPY